MQQQVKQILHTIRWKNFLVLTLAGLINAFGITIFLTPVKLYDSGISGTSMLLSQVTPEQLSLSLFLILLNFPLFLFGLKRQGPAFTIYSLYTVAVYSLGAWLITEQPDEISQALMTAFSRGLTKIPVKGGYSNADKTMIYFVANRFQIAQMRQIVHAIDPYAYMTISDVADVFRGQQMS